MPAVSYQRFADEVLEVVSLRASATACKMRQALREFGEVPGVKKTSDVRPATVARWLLAHANRAPATNDSLLRSFRTAVAIGVASGYIRHDPFAVRIEVPDHDPAREGRRRHHPAAEIARVLALASEEAAAGDWKSARTEALAYLFAYAALRKMEGLCLAWEDLDFGRSVLRVRPERQPSGRLKTRASAASVPLAPPLAEVLRRWRARAQSAWVVPNTSRTNPWTGGPPGSKALDAVRRLGARAGVEGLTILSFRHSFATHAAAWGIPAPMVQRILRHTSVRTQRAYVHEDVADLVAAVAGVRYAAPGPARALSA